MKKILIGIFIIILSLTACTAPAAPQPTPITQSSPTNIITPSTTPVITSTPEPNLTPSTTPLSGGMLNEEGPWLMYQHEDGSIYFVNPDGTGIHEINSDIGSIANGYLFTSSNEYKTITFYEFNNSNTGRSDARLNIYAIQPFIKLHEIYYYPSEDDSYHTIPVYKFATRNGLPMNDISRIHK